MGLACSTYPKYKYIQGFGYPLKKWLGWPQRQFEVLRRTGKSFAPVGMRTSDLPASSRIPCSKMWVHQNVPLRCTWDLLSNGTLRSVDW